LKAALAIVVLVLSACTQGADLRPAPTDAQAQEAHATGQCGSLGPGTGLAADGRGWVVSMLPGRHEFRVVGGGTVVVSAAKVTELDFDAGRLYYLVKTGSGRLEWKVPGSDWGPVSKLFLYPPQGNPYKS